MIFFGFTNKISDKERYSLISIFLITYIFYGSIAASPGVALQTLKHLFNFNMNQLSWGISIQSIGGCISGVLGIFLINRMNIQIQLSIYIFILSILSILYPFAPSFAVFMIINFFMGFFSIFISTILNSWVVELTRPKENTFVQILHFAFSFGMLLCPFFLGPYLDEEEEENNDELIFKNNDYSTNETLIFSNQINTNTSFTSRSIKNSLLSFISLYLSSPSDKAEVWKPLLFLGIVLLIISFVHFAAYFIKPYKENDSKQPTSQELNNNFPKSLNNLIEEDDKSKNLTRSYYITFVIMVTIIVTVQVGNEMTAFNFLPTYVKESHPDLSNKESALIFNILQYFIAGVRFVNIFLSFKLNAVANIFFNFVVLLIGNLILLFYSQTSLTALKVGIGFLGLGYSTSYPLFIAYVDKSITLSNTVSSLMSFGSVLSLSISPLIIGPLIEKDSIYYCYISLGMSMTTAVLFFSLYAMEVLRLRKL